MIPTLVALVGFTAAGIVWVSDKGLALWWIVLYSLIIILFIILSYLAFRKVAKERDTAIEDKEKAITELALARERLSKAQSRPAAVDASSGGRITIVRTKVDTKGNADALRATDDGNINVKESIIKEEQQSNPPTLDKEGSRTSRVLVVCRETDMDSHDY